MIDAAEPLRLWRVALDACCFVGSRTGIANYVTALLQPMCLQHPEVTFHLYCNDEGNFPALPNIVTRISRPKRRGPIWHNTHVVDMIRDDGIDVFWGTNGLIPLRGLRDTATVATVHDMVERFAPGTQQTAMRWKQKIFQPWCARAADRLVTVSQATGDDVATFYRRSPDQVIQPLAAERFGPVDAAAADVTVRELQLPERFILSVGTLEPRKNIVALIEAHSDLFRAGVNLPQLVVVGGRGWLDARLQAVIESASATGAVRFLGYLPAEVLPHLYARCMALVMPSLYEGFGMPLLEAQLCGAPVVHGLHKSMTEAAGGLGVAVEPDGAGLSAMLKQLAAGELPIQCRLPSTIGNDADASAKRMWQVMVAALEAKRSPASSR